MIFSTDLALDKNLTCSFVEFIRWTHLMYLFFFKDKENDCLDYNVLKLKYGWFTNIVLVSDVQ